VAGARHGLSAANRISALVGGGILFGGYLHAEDTRARLTGDVLKKAKDYRRDEVKG